MPSSAPPSDPPRRRFSPLGAVKAFFTHDVQLRRDGKNVLVELAPRPSKQPALSVIGDPGRSQGFPTLPMYVALKSILDTAPNSRETLRHLAAVERQLLRRGCLHLEKLTVPALEVVLRQFDGLTERPLSQPLAELRAQIVAAAALQRRQMLEAQRERLAAAAAASAADEAQAKHPHAPSTLLGDKLEISEGTPTDFQRVAGG